jgi:hypothetical protein
MTITSTKRKTNHQDEIAVLVRILHINSSYSSRDHHKGEILWEAFQIPLYGFIESTCADAINRRKI